VTRAGQTRGAVVDDLSGCRSREEVHHERHPADLRRSQEQDGRAAGLHLEIRRDVQEARSRPGLTELYRRAGYLITLTHAPSWQQKFGKDAAELRTVGEEEFRKTARMINRRAAEIGTAADYDETWGD
jgi:hypothetical protein